MFSKSILSLLTLSFTLAVIATPTPDSGPNQNCNVGAVQCCDQVQKAGSPAASTLLGSLGIVLQDLNIPVGISCSPIDVLGVGSSGNCAADPVCCENNSFNGLIAIGCTPINVFL